MTFAYENGSQTSTIAEKPSRVRRRAREEEEEEQPAAPSIAHGPSPASDARTRQRLKQSQQRRHLLRDSLERARDNDNDARSFGWRTDFALGATPRRASESRPPPFKYQSSRRNQYFSAFFSVLFSLVLVGQGSRVPVASARNYRQLQHQLPSSNGGGSGGPNHHHPFPSSSSNAAPPFPRQLSHPEAPKVSRLRKSAVAGNGGGKTSSTTTEPPASTTTDEPDIIPVWLSLENLKKYNYTSLTRYGDVCPAMAPRAPLSSFDRDRTMAPADSSSDRGAHPTEVSAASRGKASSPFFGREPVSNLQCLPLDEIAINALCSAGAYTCSSRGYGPRFPPSGDSAAAGSDRWGSVHLSFCSRYNLTSLIPDNTRDKIRGNKTLCESTLRTLVTLDNTSRDLDCEFDTVIARYDCDTGYSVNSNCSYCKKAYRKWVCAMMLPFHAESRRVKACRSFCHLVEQRCPYFHPFIKEQYAGEPAFKCIDRNIPDIPDLTPKSAYGGDNDCYTACDLDPLDNDDPVLNCRREERTAKKGRGESGATPSATTTERVLGADRGAPGQATTTSGATTRASVDAFEQPDTKTERYRTGTRPTEEPEGGRDGGGTLAPFLPPDQNVSANHSTRRGTASSDPAAATASWAAATDATPGASPSNSAATSTSTTYLLLEPWIVATSGAMASLVVTLILTSRVRYRPPLARTSSPDAIATPTTPSPAATSKTRVAKTGPYRRRRYESRRRRLRPRYLVTD